MILGVKVWKTASKEWLGLKPVRAEMLSWERGSARLGRDGCWCCCKPQCLPYQLLTSSAQAVGIVLMLWSRCDNPSLSQGAVLWFGSRD